VGEPRRGPEGPHHGQHGFGSFCLYNKGRALRDASGKTSAAETNPGPKINNYILTPYQNIHNTEVRASGATYHLPPQLNP
ncbi:MAG: hypothetical protein WBO24_19440, partial [Nitrospirales bacterium]